MSEEKPRRERGMGRVWVRGRTLWIQFYNKNGEQKREPTKFKIGPDEDSNKHAFRAAEKEVRKRIGEAAAGIVRDSCTLRYEDLRAKLCSDYQVNARKSLRHDGDGNPWLDKVARLDDFFSGWRASQIDADAIRKFDVEQQANGLSNASVNRSISALRRAFNIARQDETLLNVPYFPRFKESAPRQGFFERPQYDALRSALPDYLRLPLALGYFTGMRAAEILGLGWEQVDLLANTINLRAGETKNDEARMIPVVPQLRVPG